MSLTLRQRLAYTGGVHTELGFVQMTSLSTAILLTLPPAGTKLAFIQAETQNVRWRSDGTSPTTSVGNILYAGDVLEYDGDVTAIKFIEVTPSAKLNIHYYG